MADIWSLEEKKNIERKGGKYHVKGKKCCRGMGEHQRLYEGEGSFSNLSEHQPQRKLPTIRPNM